ncbi:MAG: DUF1588 domain-containing protein [Verrucomicrobia bacterium]|nr:DUF1588 domain-containing protein [Verrucomicrobiota bacterium]MDA1048139.1 DUF1588 domain-containing protein [Verrucomicrobiota bacterium]
MIRICIFGVWIASTSWLVASEPARDKGQEFFRAFSKQHCVRCHNPEKKKGKFLIHDLVEISNDRTRFAKVLEMVRTGDMPPEDEPQPTLEDLDRVAKWIEKTLGTQVPTSTNQDPTPVRPHEGNHIPHTLLFGVDPGPVIPPPPRTWRLSPSGYSSGLLRSLKMDERQIPNIPHPFALRTDPGIKDYSALYWVDEGTTDVLIRNAERVVNIMTSHKLHTPKNGGPVRVSMARRGGPLAPEEFAPLLHPEVKPKREELKTAALLLFRRALVREPSQEELHSLLELYEKSAKPPGDHISAAKTMLMAPLLSAEALHRFELGNGSEIRTGVRMLSPKELAFAISLAFSGDREPGLFEAATKGELKTREDVEKHVRRILNDPEIYKPRILGFFHEYFGYNRAPDVCKDEQRDYVHKPQQLVLDTDRLVLDILEKDQNVLKELLTTPKSYVNKVWLKRDGELARWNLQDSSVNKQMSKFISSKWDRVELDKPSMKIRPRDGRKNFIRAAYGLEEWPEEQPAELPDDRIGILMQPSWLVAWSSNFFNDPVRRGLWIREHLLGHAVPPVPVGVVIVLPDDPKHTLRERMEITKDAKCWTCHQKIDDLGFPFEAFDHFGRPRIKEMSFDMEAAAINKENSYRKYAKGEKRPEKLQEYHALPLVTTGHIRGSGIPEIDGPVENAQEMIRKLADSERVRQVFIRYVFRYYMGRNETPGDAATLQTADKVYVESQGSFQELLVSLLTSESFLCRTINPHLTKR